MEIIKVNRTTLNEIVHDEQLKAYTEMLAGELVSMHHYMLRASVILAAIADSGCYKADGFETVHDYTRAVLNLKRAQSYALLKVGREYVNTETFQSLLPHEEGNDYSASQLQALLPLKSVDTATELAEEGVINPDMTVTEIKAAVKAYRDSLKGGDSDEPADSEGSGEILDESESSDGDTPVRRWICTHEVRIGYYEDNGDAVAYLDGELVEYETAYQVIANGFNGNNL